MLPLLFCAIVAVVEVEVDMRHAPIAEFLEFPEGEAQNKISCTNSHTGRKEYEAVVVFACHLGGLLGKSWCWRDGGGKSK